MNTISIISFIMATGAVAFFTVRIVRGMKKSDNATEEYFTGGRALAWPVVAGSLLLQIYPRNNWLALMVLFLEIKHW